MEPIIINDQTFFVNGKPHQIVIDSKNSDLYNVVEIREVPEQWSAWATGLIRVLLHRGDLLSCFSFIETLINS